MSCHESSRNENWWFLPLKHHDGFVIPSLEPIYNTWHYVHHSEAVKRRPYWKTSQPPAKIWIKIGRLPFPADLFPIENPEGIIWKPEQIYQTNHFERAPGRPFADKKISVCSRWLQWIFLNQLFELLTDMAPRRGMVWRYTSQTPKEINNTTILHGKNSIHTLAPKSCNI